MHNPTISRLLPSTLVAALAIVSAQSTCPAAPTPTSSAAFTDESDVGDTARHGTSTYDEASQTYTVGGGGENMWGTVDAFHFVWKRMSGDFAFAADIEFVGTSAQPHRKACLVVRQSLEPDSVYADAALHGDGLTSLQFRLSTGDVTHEVQSMISAPHRLGLERVGDRVLLLLPDETGALRPSGCSVQIHFDGPVYVGLGVCAHDNAAFEQAVFSNVELGEPIAESGSMRSSLETIAVASGDRRCVYHTGDLIEAPNWTPDGSALIFNREGRLYRLPLEVGAAPVEIDTGSANQCNNDHGISPDGTQLVVSDQSEQGKSLIRILPISGGEPRRVTDLGPSYWHGWSPDGKTLAYCAERDGAFDVYTIPVTGGAETRLTDAPGLDDGPDYSPDGKFIYFNSERTGLMQIWRMRADGFEQTQITSDGFADWFAHPSPDGRWLVFISYSPDVQGHPRDKDVRLRLMSLESGEIRELARFNGGQGTINVPSWSPDSEHFAYVRYEPPAG